MKLYIASSLKNAALVKKLSIAAEEQGCKITYCWADHGPQPQRMHDVAKAEVAGVFEADVVLMVLPGGYGTHVELGLAAAMSKPVVIIGSEHDFQMQGRGFECCFYHLPQILSVRLDGPAALFTGIAGEVHGLIHLVQAWHRDPEPCQPRAYRLPKGMNIGAWLLTEEGADYELPLSSTARFATAAETKPPAAGYATTEHEHVFRNVKTGRYHYSDEAFDFSVGDFDTAADAKVALGIYLDRL